MDLSAIQSVLREHKLDAWLFYDHHHRDAIAYRVLGLPEDMMVSRRWFYLIPANGEPRKLVHRIEAFRLDSLPGSKRFYSGWAELDEEIKTLTAGYTNIAMQYSPNNRIFYVGLVDAGTVELIRSFGKNIVSSADLVAQFEATWSVEQIESHFAAGKAIDAILAAAFQEIGTRVRNGGTNEYEMQKWIQEAFAREDMVSGDGPDVAVNGHSGDPHYEPTKDVHSPIQLGDWVLIDLWSKKNTPNACFYDICWTGCVGTPSDEQRKVFGIVTEARDKAIEFVKSSVAAGADVRGWQVDDIGREHIEAAGYGEYFTHRTGHSIGTEIHANGANLDNLEVHDERRLLPNSCFSVEPGIYLKNFGVRSEVDMLIRNGAAEVTGRIQREIVQI